MKRFILVAILVGVLAALTAGTALAAGPVNPPAQGFGPGTCSAASCAGYGHGMGAGGMMRRGAPEWAGQPEEVEKLLGLTDEQIRAERLAGKSLAQIAASKNINEETLINTILDAKKADLAKLVADGKLTQAQADYMAQHMQTQIKTMVERTNVGPAFSRGGAQQGFGSRDGQGFGRRWNR